MKNKNFLIYIILALFIILGFWFRYIGIEKGLSFWNDEGHVAIFSREILNRGTPILDNGYSTGIYQIALYYITAFSFYILGVGEFSARLPSVLAGTFLIWLAYFVANKLFNSKVALVSAFLVSFSQIQLAWSTQLRPYIWLEIFTVLTFYFGFNSLKSKKIINKEFIISIIIALSSLIFHLTGFYNLFFLSLVFIYRCIRAKNYKLLLFILALPILLVGIISGFSNNSLSFFIYLLTPKIDILHYRIFLTHHYYWLIIGTLIGGIFLYKKNRELFFALSSYMFIIFFTSIFIINNYYVRYSLPGFPLLYILFGYGTVSLAEKISKKFSVLIMILMIGSLFLTGKVLYQPAYYYSINADMRENPIVDYKTGFAKIKKLIGDNKCIVMDAWNDRVPWYMPVQEYIFVGNERDFFGGIPKDPVFGERMIGAVKNVQREVENNKCGVVIVENWESIMSEDIKKFVKTNLKHEFNVNNLPYNEDDKWSISIYSWGL